MQKIDFQLQQLATCSGNWFTGAWSRPRSTLCIKLLSVNSLRESCNLIALANDSQQQRRDEQFTSFAEKLFLLKLGSCSAMSHEISLVLSKLQQRTTSRFSEKLAHCKTQTFGLLTRFSLSYSEGKFRRCTIDPRKASQFTFPTTQLYCQSGRAGI